MLLRELADAGFPLLGVTQRKETIFVSHGHPYRKSISFALFSAFLSRLQSTHPLVFSPTAVDRLLREAALQLTVQRVNEEWARVAAREGRAAPVMVLEDDDVRVVRGSRAPEEPYRLEREDLLKYWRRVTRGLPELQGDVP